MLARHLPRIKAPIHRCFDLSRDIDLHMQCTARMRKVAISSVTKGLIGPHEDVTWGATRCGIRQRLTSTITVNHCPFRFRNRVAEQQEELEAKYNTA